MIRFRTNVAYTQAYGCKFCLHVGSLAVFFGTKNNGAGPRLELFTQLHWFSWSKGYTQ